jgi:hypothetical protein
MAWMHRKSSCKPGEKLRTGINDFSGRNLDRQCLCRVNDALDLRLLLAARYGIW